MSKPQYHLYLDKIKLLRDYLLKLEKNSNSISKNKREISAMNIYHILDFTNELLSNAEFWQKNNNIVCVGLKSKIEQAFNACLCKTV